MNRWKAKIESPRSSEISIWAQKHPIETNITIDISASATI